MNLDSLVRDNIKTLKPYSSARHEFDAHASIMLDANENAFGSPVNTNYNRYPDPYQTKLKNEIATINQVANNNIILGNGSDEIIDLAIRIFCEPSIDEIIISSPTYGMYKVCADINNIKVNDIHLNNNDFSYLVDNVLNAVNSKTKIIFICSPNNPTGQLVPTESILEVLNKFNGLVIIDEAYLDFSSKESNTKLINEYNNLLVLKTFSKAWGLAGLRLGMAFGSNQLINWFNKIKPPYNINEATQNIAIDAIKNINWVTENIKKTNKLKDEFIVVLNNLSFVKKVFKSDTNFVLFEVADAEKLYNYLTINEIVVRNRTKDINCNNCLRITIGNEMEMNKLIITLKEYIA